MADTTAPKRRVGKKPDTPCRICRKLLYKSQQTRTPGLQTCRSCRRMNWVNGKQHATYITPRTCATCCRLVPATVRNSEFCSKRCSEWWRSKDPRRIRYLIEAGLRPGPVHGPPLPHGWVRAPFPASNIRFCEECGTCLTGTKSVCPGVCTNRKTSRGMGCTPTGESKDYRCKCGVTWTAPSKRGRDPLCPKCKADSRAAAHRRRRARERGATSDNYNRIDIFNRDEWTCQLCGDPVLRCLSVPHRRAATIDHIVPLARHGHDVTENVQLAHFACNSSKGARWVG